jgi:single-stranded-DNA-specific exonuclease
MKGISGKEWVLLSEFIKPEADLSERLGPLKAQLLANRNLGEEALESRLSRLLPPFGIPNIQEAVELIGSYVKRGKRIVIFGDYDVDGITGTAILYHLLKKAGARVLPLLPSRKRGYGLTKELVIKLSRYADLLITVDNGSTAVEELSHSTIPVIVLDHHNLPEDMPRALMVNPKLGEGGELREIASSGLVFYMSALLRRSLELDLDVRNYLHLACMGTVADVMPMNLINRILVSNGIRLLNHVLKGGFHAPGIRFLMERSGIRDEVSSRDIAFSLAPRLNAPGRVAKPYVALKLLLEDKEEKARVLVERIDRLNQHRRQLSHLAFDKAIQQAREQSQQSVIIVKLEDWAGGVAGIVAGRLSALFSKPAVVISVGKEYSSASVRGVEGMDVHSILKRLSHLFVKWGGHASAAGFTIRTENIPEFESLAIPLFSELSSEEGKLYIDMTLPLCHVDQELYQTIKELEPYGEGFPEPVFLSEPLNLRLVGGSRERLMFRVEGFNLLSWDSNINGRLPLPGAKPRRIVYQPDRRRPNTLLLVDVEV